MTTDQRKGKYFTMTCLIPPGGTARKIMDAADSSFIMGEFHDSRPHTAILDQLSYAIDLLDECLDLHQDPIDSNLHQRIHKFLQEPQP